MSHRSFDLTNADGRRAFKAFADEYARKNLAPRTSPMIAFVLICVAVIAVIARWWGIAGVGEPGGVATFGEYEFAAHWGAPIALVAGCVALALLFAGRRR